MRWRLDPGQIEVVDDKVAEILCRKTPAERLAMIFDCNEFVRGAVKGRIRFEHPEWTEEKIQTELVRRILGEANPILQPRH